MIKIFAKLICIFVPFKAWRRAIRTRLGLNEDITIMSQLYLFDKKYRFFIENKNSIEYLFMGSSHAHFGYDEKIFTNKMCDFSFISQDIQIGLSLYRQLYKELPKLKKCFITYSVFSPGFQAEYTSERWYSSFYKSYFDMQYYNDENNNLLIDTEKKIEKYRKKNLKKILEKPKQDNKAEKNTAIAGMCAVEDRADSHLKNNLRSNKGIQFLKELHVEALKNGHDLVIIIPPATQSYKENLPSYKELFSGLFDLELEILNMYDDVNFDGEDFEDHDHLNAKGAEKYSKKILSYIEKYQINH